MAGFSEIVYGTDDRFDPINIGLSEVDQIITNHTMAMFSPGSIQKKDDKLFVRGITLGQERKLCEGERFSDQVVAATCSGFLVTPRIVMTAGHCMRTAFKCASFVWVKNFKTNDQGSDIELKNDDIYRCKEIITQKINRDSGEDFALILLDRKVNDFNLGPLSLRKKDTKIAEGQELGVSGFPSGIPMKLAKNGNVVQNSKKHYFSANLDTFGGNSGSVVYSESENNIEGILVRGNTDYIKKTYTETVVRDDGVRVQEEKTCFAVNVVEQTPAGDEYEEIVRVTSIEELYYTKNDLLFLDSIKNGDIETASDLLDQNVNVNVRDLDNGKTALHYAVENKVDREFIIDFLSRSPNIQIRDYEGNMVLFLAFEDGNEELLKDILNSPFSFEKLDFNGKAILHKLVEARDLEKLQKLVELGVNLDVQSKDGDSALMVAIKYDNFEITRLLVENGADLNIRNNDNKNAIRLSVDRFDLDMLKYFISRGARPSRGTVNWILGKNDLSYVKKVLKRAKDFDSIHVETLKKMVRVIKDAKGDYESR